MSECSERQGEVLTQVQDKSDYIGADDYLGVEQRSQLLHSVAHELQGFS